MDGDASIRAAVRTTCPYCGVGCGLRVSAEAGTFKVQGDPEHPANAGRLCVKGSALGETLGLEARLLQPMLQTRQGADGTSAARTPVSWDEALDKVADGFRRIIDEHGPDAVAFYVSGQLLTEDYYVANKLMKGYVGSANIDTNSRLCMSSAVAGHQRAFGEDVVPVDYADVEAADVVVLVGSNLAWCHPVLYQRLNAAREQRPGLKVVVIDPRRTATCDIADMHLPLKPGSDVALFNGLLQYLHGANCIDADFVAESTSGLRQALAAAARDGDTDAVADITGLEREVLGAFYALFAQHASVVTLFSQGVNQSSSGTDKVNAIINCHLLTGRIGKPGSGPFSITGQPNAMGGREVGGLANQLAAHLQLADAKHRDLLQSFWQSPRIAQRPGLKAVDLFDAMHDGRVKAVWIMATNPVVSLPDADRARAALDRCELVVVSEAVAETDTNRHADVLLPAASWGERDGTVTNSERVISRQRPFRAAPGDARPDWWIISEVARRLGYGDAFDYDGVHEIFDEHARLTACGNDGSRQGKPGVAPRLLNLAGLTGMSALDYDAMAPTQWPAPAGCVAARPFADGRFSHPDGRARFIATAWRAPVNAPDADFPLILNTGRVRDQWHTMTRTGLAPTLAQHRHEPTVDMHAADALAAGVQVGGLGRVSSRWGSMVVRVTSSGDMKRDEVFAPIHWNGMNAADARVGALVNPVVDAYSGEPEFKHTPVRVEPFAASWYGFALARRALPMPQATWWVRVQGTQFLRYEMAGLERPADVAEWARQLAGVPGDGDWIDYADAAHGSCRGVWFSEGRIAACVFLARRPDLPARNWLAEQFGKSRFGARQRAALLAGEAPQQADMGPTICSCFGVGRNSIVDAIGQQKLASCADVTRVLKAGGNCGSCMPEIRALLADLRNG